MTIETTGRQISDSLYLAAWERTILKVEQLFGGFISLSDRELISTLPRGFTRKYIEDSPIQTNNISPLQIPLKGGEYLNLGYIEKQVWGPNLVFQANLSNTKGELVEFPWVNTWGFPHSDQWYFFGGEHGWNDHVFGDKYNPNLKEGDAELMHQLFNRLALTDFKRDVNLDKIDPARKNQVLAALQILTSCQNK